MIIYYHLSVRGNIIIAFLSLPLLLPIFDERFG